MQSVFGYTKFAFAQCWLPVLMLWVALTLPIPLTASPAEATIYVNEYFEVRDHDQPVKYVFNGDTRVARITGSLSTNTRIQRLRLQPGWNLCSVAVSDSPLPFGGEGQGERVVTAAYKWNQTGLNWLAVSTNETLAAGTVLWLHAATNTTLALTGIYSEPANRAITSGGSFQPSAGLESWDLPSTLRFQPSTDLWRFDSSNQGWQVQAPGIPGSETDFSEFLAPSEALFINADVPVELAIPPAELRVRFYHQDHLGSSSVVTDADGAIIEETAFYPFGVERHAYRPRQIEENYQFTQKERDHESGLHYFEARFLAGSIARFISTDPKYARLDGLSPEDLASFLSSPREINPYQYALNNPLKYNDPTGLDKVETTSTTADVVGIAAGGAEEAAIVAYGLGKTAPSVVTTGAGVAGKASAAVSVGIKAVQFIDDPSYATGGQLANESAKTLVGVAAPPVGLIWSILDLTGYGPSAILEHTEKSIQANREATKFYQQATAASRQTVALVNEAAPKIQGKLQQADAKLQQLVKATDKLNQTTRKSLKGETRSLKELNDAIRKQERINRRTRAELKRAEANLRKLQE